MFECHRWFFCCRTPVRSCRRGHFFFLCWLFNGLPLLYYFAGRRGPVTTADLWGDFPLPSALDSGLRRDVASAPPSGELPPLLQLVVCAPVGLLAGAILICVVPSMRRVAFSLVGILWELKSRISSFNAK